MPHLAPLFAQHAPSTCLRQRRISGSWMLGSCGLDAALSLICLRTMSHMRSRWRCGRRQIAQTGRCFKAAVRGWTGLNQMGSARAKNSTAESNGIPH